MTAFFFSGKLNNLHLKLMPDATIIYKNIHSVFHSLIQDFACSFTASSYNHCFINPVLAKENCVITFIPLCLHWDLFSCFHFVSCQLFEETAHHSCIEFTRYVQLAAALIKKDHRNPNNARTRHVHDRACTISFPWQNYWVCIGMYIYIYIYVYT